MKRALNRRRNALSLRLVGEGAGESSNEQGQSLVFVAFAFVGILGFVGLAIDLGAVYVERVNTGRAVDAAALAAASELPLEEAAHQRALVYLQDNGYDHEAADTEHAEDKYHDGDYSGDDPGGSTTIWTDTQYAQHDGVQDTADHIRVRVRRNVPMMFMQFLGFNEIAVEAVAEAENINHIDTVIVYDESGSMEFDTLCYGCWEPSATNPDGEIFPLDWNAGQHCSGSNRHYEYVYEYYGHEYRHPYIIIEAEEYSYMTVDYHDWGYTPYYTFWVVQRNDWNIDRSYESWEYDPVGAYGRDTRGAYISHHPFSDYRSGGGLGVSCTWDGLDDPGGPYCRDGVPGGPFPTPRVDYDFEVPESGNYYIWVRGQGGGTSNTDDDYIFWGLGESVEGKEDNFDSGPYYDGAQSDDWDWRRLSRGEYGSGSDSIWFNAVTTYTLNLWAGGAGFDVDRIIITTCPWSSLPTAMRGTAAPNNGRTGWACDQCDPRFAGRPGGDPECAVDMRFDDIYQGEQPIRDALDSAERFISLLDPQLDQVGYVSYGSQVNNVNELECLRRLGPQTPTGGCRPQVISDTVQAKLENTYAGGSTNIAGGMRRGISALSTTSDEFGDHFGRPSGAHVMILMTDGEANRYPGCEIECSYSSCWWSPSNCDRSCPDDVACCQENYWPDDLGDDPEDLSKDCVMYYAQDALDNGIVIYTISLGWSADRELMEAVAEETGGYHRWAPTPDRLDEIFDELYERIFIRLVK